MNPDNFDTNENVDTNLDTHVDVKEDNNENQWSSWDRKNKLIKLG